MFPGLVFGNESSFNCNLMTCGNCDRINISIWNEYPVNTTWETSLFFFLCCVHVYVNFVCNGFNFVFVCLCVVLWSRETHIKYFTKKKGGGG